MDARAYTLPCNAFCLINLHTCTCIYIFITVCLDKSYPSYYQNYGYMCIYTL